MNRGLLLLLALGLSQLALADTYRWKDKEGRTFFGNQPPLGARDVQVVKRTGARPLANAEAPDTRPPLTLFSSACGAPCDEAKALLDQRQAPYTLKEATEPANANQLKQLTGALEVPVLTIGGNVHKGFEKSLWSKLLDVAGYRPPAPKPAEAP